MAGKFLKRVLRLKNDKERLAEMLRHSTNHLRAIDGKGNTLLHQAVEENNVTMIQTLLDHGADPNARNKIGCTPLHWAVICNSYEIVKILLDHNAYVNARSNFGKTPLHLLALQKEDAVSQRIAELLLSFNASTVIRDNKGYTPIDYLRNSQTL